MRSEDSHSGRTGGPSPDRPSQGRARVPGGSWPEHPDPPPYPGPGAQPRHPSTHPAADRPGHRPGQYPSWSQPPERPLSGAGPERPPAGAGHPTGGWPGHPRPEDPAAGGHAGQAWPGDPVGGNRRDRPPLPPPPEYRPAGSSGTGRASVPADPHHFGPPNLYRPDPSASQRPDPSDLSGRQRPDPSGAPPTPVRRRRRTGLLLSAAILLVLALLASVLVVFRPGPVDGWLAGGTGTPATPTDPPEPAPSPVLAPIPTNAPIPTPEGVAAALDALVRVPKLGPRVHISVADVATGQSVYSLGSDTNTVPASVTKLVTAVAVLAARGPTYRIPTRAVAGANPGEVVLVGDGDPTLAAGEKGFYAGAARLDQLAQQVRQALGGTAPTRVIVDGSRYSGPVYEPGWDSDIPTGGYGGPVTALMLDGARTDPKATPGWAARTNTPDLAAGAAFARALGLPDAGAVVKGRAPAAPDGTGPSATAAAPAASGGTPAEVVPGTELGRVESPPMIRLVEVMLAQSDNLVAEALARQVALARNKPGSFVGAAAATEEVLAELGLPGGEIELADGSGLSRSNRISPSLLTDLLVLAGRADRPELAGLFAGLPVAGWSGTLADRYGETKTAAGAGVVRAKTGTLTKVHAIAGVLTTAEGRLLAFAILTDQVPVGLEEAQPALDRIAVALAGCGCR